MPHRPKRSRALVTGVLAAATLAGCGTPTPAAPAQQEPGPVAVAYTQALVTGDLATAGRFVLPADRSTLANLTIPHGLVVHSENLAVGSSTVQNSTATVVLTGKICNSTPSRTHSASAPPDCIANSDPHSTNPLFRLAMVRDRDQKWYVSMPGITDH